MLRVQSSAWHKERFSTWMSWSVSGFALTCTAMRTWSSDVRERGQKALVLPPAGTFSGKSPGMGWQKRSSGSVLQVQLHPQVSLGAVCASLLLTQRQERREHGGERPDCFNSQRLKDVSGHRMQLTISNVPILGLVTSQPQSSPLPGAGNEVEDTCTAQGRTSMWVSF